MEKWRDVSAEEFAIEASEIDPEAGVEILFAEFKAMQNYNKTGLNGTHRTYHRMKVFNETGVNLLARHIVTPERGERIKGIIARTVKADGTVVELDPEDVYDVTLEEDSDGVDRAKSFAFPSLEAGDIVECQVEYDIDGVWGLFTRFTGPFPCRRVTARIKPAKELSHRVISFGFPADKLDQKDGDYYLYELENVRAEINEKYAVPRLHAEPYVVMYYVKEFFDDPEDFWKDFTWDLAGDARKDFKSNNAVKAKARELTAGAASDEEKLRRLLTFCTTEITNLAWDNERFSKVERDKLKNNSNAAETLQNGYGKPRHIRSLFGALASAVGLDARYVAISDRRHFFFSKDVYVRAIMKDRLIAVRDGESWLFFDPGHPVLGFGELSWNHADSLCLVGDSKEILFVKTPKLKSEESITDTLAQLEISEAGTLSGRVTKTLSGQSALSKRNAYRRKSMEEIEELIEKDEVRHYTDAKVTNIKVENLNGAGTPLLIAYDLEIKSYADTAGDRIFIAPALFQKGLGVPFIKDERLSDIIFNSPWQDLDRIEIALPDGYEFEAGDAPKPFDVGGVVVFDSAIRINKKTNTLILDRKFSVNQDVIPRKAYPFVKKAFETMKVEDAKSITVKKTSSES